MRQGSLRNLDQIQETEAGGAGSSGARVGALVMASIAGACVVFACFALVKRPRLTAEPSVSPLDELVQKSAEPGKATVDGQRVAFPALLSDEPNPTTAMASIRTGTQGAADMQLPAGAPTVPPAAGDRLPVVPLPAQNYLSMNPVVAEPRDTLTALATKVSSPSGEEAPAGQPGGFQLQVSSFRTQAKADEFALRLRRTGHRAHVVSATVNGKGSWFRVRIGPFKNKWEAMRYRKEFEQREHIVTFLVEPDKKATAFIAE